MHRKLLRPDDSPERKLEKLSQIVTALMKRVEAASADNAYNYFHTAAALEAKVRARTHDLEQAMDQLNQSRSRLDRARHEAESARADLADALEAVREGFALFGQDSRLIMSNSRFARLFPDIRQKVTPGLLLDDYFSLVSESSALLPSEGMSRGEWLSERRARHLDLQVGFILELTGDRWIQVSERPTSNGGTAILQTEVTATVRRERLERDKLLDAQSKLVRATLDHLDQGVATFDADRLLLAWNIRLLDLLPLPAEIMQVGAEFHQLVETLRKHGVFQRVEKIDRIMQWVNNQESQRPLRDELLTRGGHHLTLAMRAMPNGGFVVSFTDVTGERRAQTALAKTNETLEARVRRRTLETESARDEALRANQAKTRFLAAASHDLLQPLNAAKLFLASVQPDALPTREAMLMQRIESAFSSVEAILHALLDISRLDGATNVQHSRIDLGALFASIAADYRETAARKGISLHFVPTRAVVLSDPGYLQRVIQNLVVNAITYTARGKVLFGARHQPEGRIRIEVWDTGPGIPVSEREAIFDEFHRLDTGMAQTAGMGLGLSIVKRAAVLLDHQLSLDSWEGRGTVFRLTLDRVQAPQIRRHEHAATEPTALPFSDMIVLVVENEPAVLDAMVLLLDQWGISPLPAIDFDVAVSLIEEIGETPDAIIADYQLDHGKTGIETIAKLRARYGDIRALLVTANRSDEIADLAQMQDISLLRKPVQPVALREWLSYASPHRTSTGI